MFRLHGIGAWLCKTKRLPSRQSRAVEHNKATVCDLHCLILGSMRCLHQEEAKREMWEKKLQQHCQDQISHQEYVFPLAEFQHGPLPQTDLQTPYHFSKQIDRLTAALQLSLLRRTDCAFYETRNSG